MGTKQGAFLQPERCKLSNNFFPNCKEAIMSYDAKVFCGTFSRNGNHFVTAGQGESLLPKLKQLIRNLKKSMNRVKKQENMYFN